MDFPAHCKLHLAASRDIGRYAFDSVLVDRKRSRLVATDGRKLVIVPFISDEQDAADAAAHPGDVLVSRETIDFATKGVTKSKTVATLRCNGATVASAPHNGTPGGRSTANTMTEPATARADVEFPHVDPVIPMHDGRPGYDPAESVRVAVDAGLLRDLLSAMGARGQVELTVYRDPSPKARGRASDKAVVLRTWPQSVDTSERTGPEVLGLLMPVMVS